MATDSAVYDALVAIGAKPGNNLTMYPWSRIREPHFDGPDKKSAGSPLSIEILFGGKSYPASSIARDEIDKPFDFRFSGNERSHPETHVGCVACLESCPVGKIGNAAYSMRDMIKNAARFSVIPDRSFKEADEVTIRIALLSDRKHGK